MGEFAGTENVTLLLTQIPAHSHAANGGAAGNLASPAGNFWSADGAGNVAAYSNASVTPALTAPAAVGSAGGNLPHDNVQPFTAISFIISLFGVFPSQN
jgi:microcystin-dependent protein